MWYFPPQNIPARKYAVASGQFLFYFNLFFNKKQTEKEKKNITNILDTIVGLVLVPCLSSLIISCVPVGHDLGSFNFFFFFFRHSRSFRIRFKASSSSSSAMSSSSLFFFVFPCALPQWIILHSQLPTQVFSPRCSRFFRSSNLPC